MKPVPLIEVKDLKKYFKVNAGTLHAVDNVNLKIMPGTTLGVVGESGCGKSTLGRTILRLLEPTAGDVFFEGENILSYDKRQMQEMRRKMQIIFQDPYSSLHPRMTVAEIIAEYLIVHKVYRNKRDMWNQVAKLMDVVGLARRLTNAYPHELDGGRRQRIGVARALSLNPQFIVCDEPVSALDVSIQAQILNLLMDIQDEFGLTYLFITHDLSVVQHISKQIVVMYLGHCIEKAQTSELFNKPAHPYTKALLEAIPIPDVSMRNKEIHVLQGEVKSPINPPCGCRFASRCDYVMDCCTKETPVLNEISPGHECACFLKGEMKK